MLKSGITAEWDGYQHSHYSATASNFKSTGDFFSNNFSKEKVVQYRPIQLHEARRLAVNLLENPGESEAMMHL
jgi:hypothetical protein